MTALFANRCAPNALNVSNRPNKPNQPKTPTQALQEPTVACERSNHYTDGSPFNMPAPFLGGAVLPAGSAQYTGSRMGWAALHIFTFKTAVNLSCLRPANISPF
jgi:hypothetical protein